MQFFKDKNLKSEENNCCTPQPKGKMPCPTCKEKAKGVLAKTLHALLKEEAKVTLECLEGFYYCKTPLCKTIYFREDKILTQKDVDVVVGLKDGATPATMCYCFNWTKQRIKEELISTNNTIALDDIKEKMNTIGCSCEVLNPSGGCCLADTAKVIKEMKRELEV